ncbi:hypothetical protein G6F59_016400 [Rhizopus arrhizus]|nr:hypothetical protein G6F59_016400 [Rhizopus arrhizus]
MANASLNWQINEAISLSLIGEGRYDRYRDTLIDSAGARHLAGHAMADGERTGQQPVRQELRELWLDEGGRQRAGGQCELDQFVPPGAGRSSPVGVGEHYVLIRYCLALAGHSPEGPAGVRGLFPFSL